MGVAVGVGVAVGLAVVVGVGVAVAVGGGVGSGVCVGVGDAGARGCGQYPHRVRIANPIAITKIQQSIRVFAGVDIVFTSFKYGQPALSRALADKGQGKPGEAGFRGQRVTRLKRLKLLRKPVISRDHAA